MLQATVFRVIGHAFDGDSDFSGLQNRSQRVWKPVGCTPGGFDQFIVSSTLFPLVVTDPLHLLKRIRDRFISGEFRVVSGGCTYILAITKIHAVAQLPVVVFDNLYIRKMHDLLPFHRFSREMVLSVFTAQWGLELFVMVLWFLLLSGLTTIAFSIKLRCHMFEMAFYLLDFDHILMEIMRLPPTPEKRLVEGDMPYCAVASKFETL
jgi:hypothetical protein